MPIVRCTENGKSGWKVENANKCFTGPGAKKKAQDQLAAIKSEQAKSEDKHILHKVSDVVIADNKED